jgi:osmotically inducible protein OsmC
MRLEKVIYWAELLATGGRDGRARAPLTAALTSRLQSEGAGPPGRRRREPGAAFRRRLRRLLLGKFATRSRKARRSERGECYRSGRNRPDPAGYALDVELKMSLPGRDGGATPELSKRP